MLERLWRATIWHPEALPPEEWKYRALKRVVLPLYDALVILAGAWAALWGSPILYRLFPEPMVDLLGALLAAVAIVCLLGVVFPRLWRVEIAGKVVLVSLIGAYAAMILAFRTNPDPTSAFVAFVVLLALPLPIFRLHLLGEEIKERREGA